MNLPIVLVTSRSFGSHSREPIALLEQTGLRVVSGDTTHDLAALREPLAQCVAWIAGTPPITDEHLALAPHLQIIARFGTGVEAVDVRAANTRGIVVTNTPGANAEAVADFVVGLMLASLRHIIAGDTAMRAGTWPSLRGRELGALAVGLVGFGAVGRGVARRLRGGFGTRVLAYDPFVGVEPMREAGVEHVADIGALAAQCDILSLHLPGGTGEPLVNAALLQRMQRGAVLINTARGDLLDEAAVTAALHEGYLSAAAVDVLQDERSLDSPLFAAPNTIITPHGGAQTLEAIDRVGFVAAYEVLRVLRGEAPRHPVRV